MEYRWGEMRTTMKNYLRERKIQLANELGVDQTGITGIGFRVRTQTSSFTIKFWCMKCRESTNCWRIEDDFVLVVSDLMIESLKSKEEVVIRRIDRSMDGSRLK